MKKHLSILLIFLTFFATCQTSEIDKIEIIGTWSITDFYESGKFKNIWEFKSDSIFNELKYKNDGDTTLAPDENGTWKLEEKKLKITVTGEDYRGVQ